MAHPDLLVEGDRRLVPGPHEQADAGDALEQEPEETILLVAHSLPIRYALDAAAGTSPAAKVGMVEYAQPYALTRAELERAVHVLETWAANPSF